MFPFRAKSATYSLSSLRMNGIVSTSFDIKEMSALPLLPRMNDCAKEVVALLSD